MSDDTDRVTDLEMRYSHLERLVEELSDLVRVQQDTLDGLVKQVRQLREGVLAGEQQPPNEKPPHY